MVLRYCGSQSDENAVHKSNAIAVAKIVSFKLKIAERCNVMG